jgi:uncharacterized protein (DUF885 family)
MARHGAVGGIAVLLVGACLVVSPAAAKTSGSKASAAASRPAVSTAPRSAFERLADAYFDDYFLRHPTAATSTGFHEHDDRLEDFSRAAIDSEVAALARFETRFATIDSRSLSRAAAIDLELVNGDIRARRLELERIRSWEKNPDRYSSAVTQSVYAIMSRRFAPPAERLRSVIARERRIPSVFADARDNLVNPPRVYTEVAIDQLPGIIGFFHSDVPRAFDAVKDPALLAEFRAANQAVIEALEKYQSFLTTKLLPRSKGDFRIGADNYRKKLLYEERVDLPLDRLLQIGWDDLRANQRRFKETALKLDPKSTPQQILDRITRDHTTPDHLLQTFRDRLSGMRRFIVDHRIVTIPSPVPPIVQETPPFARALTFASMDTPGPFEKVAKEAYFNVTLPGPELTPAQVEEYMQGFNRGVITSTAIHETYPGHYVQFLWVPRAPSKVRKLLGCASNAEGWAHYCEQMMLDEGYGDGDLGLRLGQLQDALLRDARFIVGIKMHTGAMTMPQAVEFFVKEGYQARPVGERETRRGTSDPTYLYYTLGKLEIIRLREDVRKAKGANFSLRQFHDQFLAQGFPPISLVRETMLGDVRPTP